MEGFHGVSVPHRGIPQFFCFLYFLVTFSQLHRIVNPLSQFRLGMISTLVLAGFVIIDLRHYYWKRPVVIGLFLFIFSLIPGGLLGLATGRSRTVLLQMIVHSICGVLAIDMYLNSARGMRRLQYILVLTAGMLSLWTMANGGHGPGLLVDENDVGLVLVMLLPFCYHIAVSNAGVLGKLVPLATLVLVFGAIASSMSRGAMVGALPTVVYIWMKSKRRLLTAGMFALIVVLAVSFSPPELIEEFKSIGATNEGTAGQRRHYWELSWKLFLNHPLFGVGALAWNNGIWSGDLTVTRAVRNSTPHSTYFQLLSELGVLGTITWTIMLVATFKSLSRTRRILSAWMALGRPEQTEEHTRLLHLATATGTGLIGALVCAAFLSFLYYPYVYTLVGFTLVLESRTSQITDDPSYSDVFEELGEAPAPMCPTPG